jgi:hypothetical protein
MRNTEQIGTIVQARNGLGATSMKPGSASAAGAFRGLCEPSAR